MHAIHEALVDNHTEYSQGLRWNTEYFGERGRKLSGGEEGNSLEKRRDSRHQALDAHDGHAGACDGDDHGACVYDDVSAGGADSPKEERAP